MPLEALESSFLSLLEKLSEESPRPVSGHALRESLLAMGWGKKDWIQVTQSLVEKGAVQRLRVVEKDGMFYTAFQKLPLPPKESEA